MASSAYIATEEITNANRISRLLMGPCADQLKDLLYFYVPPSKFPEVIKKSRLPGFMSVNHRKLILPKSGAYKGDYGDMDITLLYTLLRNICGIKEHRAGWGEKPQASDRSVSANIERIRLARNQCGHSTGGLLSNADFNQIWSSIRASVMDLDLELGNGNKYEKEVDFIRHDTMDPVRDQHYRDQLMMQTIENQATIEEVNRLKRKYLHLIHGFITKPTKPKSVPLLSCNSLLHYKGKLKRVSNKFNRRYRNWKVGCCFFGFHFYS